MSVAFRQCFGHIRQLGVKVNSKSVAVHGADFRKVVPDDVEQVAFGLVASFVDGPEHLAVVEGTFFKIWSYFDEPAKEFAVVQHSINE